jgi:hypothetical protein
MSKNLLAKALRNVKKESLKTLNRIAEAYPLEMKGGYFYPIDDSLTSKFRTSGKPRKVVNLDKLLVNLKEINRYVQFDESLTSFMYSARLLSHRDALSPGELKNHKLIAKAEYVFMDLISKELHKPEINILMAVVNKEYDKLKDIGVISFQDRDEQRYLQYRQDEEKRVILYENLINGGKKYKHLFCRVREFDKYKKLANGRVTIPQMMHYDSLAAIVGVSIALIHNGNRKDKLVQSSIQYLKDRYGF